MALGVVNNDAAAGKTANLYFATVAAIELGPNPVSKDQLSNISLRLMQADLAARITNGGTDLTVDDIQRYHEDVFNEVAGVSADAWTPNRALANLDSLEDRQAYWDGLITSTAVGSYLDTALVAGINDPAYIALLTQVGATAQLTPSNSYGPYDISVPGAGQMIGGDQEQNNLSGGDAADVLIGFNGDDVLIGGAGADRMHGGDGDDTADYSGESAGIRIEYGDIQDATQAELWENFGRGRISQVTDGSGALDTLIDVERLIGTDFDDVLSISAEYLPSGLLGGGLRENGIDLGGEGEGGDTVDFSPVAGRGVVGSLEDGTAIIGLRDFPVEILEVQGVEVLKGSSSHDDLTEGNGDGQIDGGQGADILDGTGEGRLNGDQGADILIYRTGATELAGGLGNDYYDFTEATGRDAVVILEEGFGRDVFSSNYSAVDRVVFEGLSSSDVTFTWDYTIQTFDQGFFTSQFYDGAATITVNAPGYLQVDTVEGQYGDFDIPALQKPLSIIYLFSFVQNENLRCQRVQHAP